MKCCRWPWSARGDHAEAEAEKAAKRLADAEAEHAEVRQMADKARRMREVNGFTQAIRDAMGVRP